VSVLTVFDDKLPAVGVVLVVLCFYVRTSLSYDEQLL
jgi:hypothetical protein